MVLLGICCAGNVSAEAAKNVLWSSYSPNGSAFSKTVSPVDLTRQTIRAEIDLSSCKYTNEGILSIGGDISVWYGSHNIHLYYTPSSRRLQLNWVNMQQTSVQSEYTLTSTDLTVELDKEGLHINGELMASYTADDQDINSAQLYYTEKETDMFPISSHIVSVRCVSESYGKSVHIFVA